MSDVPDEMPRGWYSATLREIAEVVGGVTKDAKRSLGQGFREVPYLRVANVQRGRLDLTEMKLISASESDIQKLKLLPGDILLNEGGDRDKLGRGWIWQGQLPLCIHQNHVFRARLLSPDIDPVYIAHFTNSMGRAYFVEQGSQTTNLASISLTKLGSLPIWLPPSREQKRIVDKLDELLTELDAGVAELQAAQKKLAQYRQSLLKAAVEGALTADWRAAHPPQESGEALLARILQERRARWETRQLDKFKAQGKTPPKGWKEKYIAAQVPASKDLPALPTGWTWSQIGMVGDVQLGRQRAPQFHSGSNMVPYLRVANVFEDRIDVSDLKSMHFSHEEEEAYRLRRDDILLNEGQSLELIGRPAIYRDELPGACFTNTLVRFRATESLRPTFALMVFLNYMHSGKFRRIASITTNIAHLGAGRFAELEFPVPPLAEQDAIVEHFSAVQKSIADQIDAVRLGQKQAAAQRQNILRAAFAGQLVPQDPADEPASALLARIRAERAATAAAPKTARRTRVSA